MDNSASIESRMDSIKAIFQEAKEYAGQYQDNQTLLEYLGTINNKYRAVAYEGIAMELAIIDFSQKENNTEKTLKLTSLYNSFLSASGIFEGHVQIGLGWAIAEIMTTDFYFLDNAKSRLQFRIWDGCGYYDGIRKQRRTLRNKERQAYVSLENFEAYDEGIGRSIWYTCKGNPTKTAEIINSFPTERQSSFWRGIGIASSFVGGNEDLNIKELATLAKNNATQLAIGAAIVAKSRIQTNCYNPEIEPACHIWCHMDAQKANKIAVKAESSANNYNSFLSKMEEELKLKN